VLGGSMMDTMDTSKDSDRKDRERPASHLPRGSACAAPGTGPSLLFIRAREARIHGTETPSLRGAVFLHSVLRLQCAARKKNACRRAEALYWEYAFALQREDAAKRIQRSWMRWRHVQKNLQIAVQTPTTRCLTAFTDVEAARILQTFFRARAMKRDLAHSKITAIQTMLDHAISPMPQRLKAKRPPRQSLRATFPRADRDNESAHAARTASREDRTNEPRSAPRLLDSSKTGPLMSSRPRPSRWLKESGKKKRTPTRRRPGANGVVAARDENPSPTGARSGRRGSLLTE